MKFRVVVADPPWGNWQDNLQMSTVKRGASSQYSVMSMSDIQNLNVQLLAAKDSVLALWCPSAILPEGLITMKNWGYDFKQTWIWVKTKQDPFKDIRQYDGLISAWNFDLNETLAFGMGRMFRQTHEIALIGTRGKIYDKLKNKSQRSVFFHPATKHSTKPEGLQGMLDKMFPRVKKLEMFARRQRKNWICIGNEADCPITKNKDIRKSIEILRKK